MKKKVWLSAFGVLVLTTAFKLADGIIEKLGMQHSSAQNYIIGNFLGNFNGSEMEEEGEAEFQIPYTKMLASVINGDKTGAAKELCLYVQQYVNSTEFAEAYKKKREQAKPDSEPSRPDQATIDEQNKSIRDLEKEINDMKKSKQVPAATIQMLEKGLADQKKILAQWNDPTPNKTRWEKNYPEDPSPIIKRRLEEYLTLVSSVDFTATVTAADKYGKKKFTNPDYEKKSMQWKAVYRAGKEVNTVVTAFVREWLKGPIISSTKTSMKQTTQATATNNQPAPLNTETIPEKKEKSSLLNKAKEKAKEKAKAIIN